MPVRPPPVRAVTVRRATDPAHTPSGWAHRAGPSRSARPAPSREIQPAEPLGARLIHESIQPVADGTVRIDAAAIADATLGVVAPGSVLIRLTPDAATVLASGATGHIDAAAAALDAPPHRVALPDRVLLPALVNAHTHLDLTHLGPIPHDPEAGFVAWVDRVRAGRATDPDAIADSVRLGIDLSLAGGTGAVGDIAGAPLGRMTDIPARTLAGSRLRGVSYLEFFGIGRTAHAATERLDELARDRLDGLIRAISGSGVRLGLQPHAPNTVAMSVYRHAAGIARVHDLALSTHLAETPEERLFVAEGIGPQRELLERLGVWDDAVLDDLARGEHPVAHLAPVLARHPTLCAHVNDATDDAIRILAERGASVAYCPRASRYFAAERRFGPHRYRAMLDAGVNVCLGTDSILNLDTPDRISVLDEMRLLARRDGTDAKTLLAMATVRGCRALGIDPEPYDLSPGPIAGLLAVPAAGGDPWGSAMRTDEPPEWLVHPASRRGPTR